MGIRKIIVILETFERNEKLVHVYHVHLQLPVGYNQFSLSVFLCTVAIQKSVLLFIFLSKTFHHAWSVLSR